MEIPDPNGPPVCSTCGPVSWMWSLRREAWVAFIPDLGDRELYRLHRCEHAQDPKTWRQVRAGDPPSPEYRKTRSKIAGRGSADV
jgi:hypothetical protein